MHSCFCMLVILSVFISMFSAAEVGFFEVADSIVVHRPPQEEQSTPRSDEGNRRKRSITSTERTEIINKINSLRSSVGASNMNYLTYSNSLEEDVAYWTSNCDCDAKVYVRIPAFVVYYVNELIDKPTHASALEQLFNDAKVYNGSIKLRSVYLQYVGASSSLCFNARDNGVHREFVYVTAYAFSTTSYFNKTMKQYTMGKQCTTCLSGSYWCDGGLCRDDCSSQISTCSCFTGCTKCTDWNRESCTCPSQPYTDAVTLNCSTRAPDPGVVTYKAASCTCRSCIASWVMIVVATLALLGLQ